MSERILGEMCEVGLKLSYQNYHFLFISALAIEQLNNYYEYQCYIQAYATFHVLYVGLHMHVGLEPGQGPHSNRNAQLSAVHRNVVVQCAPLRLHYLRYYSLFRTN